MQTALWRHLHSLQCDTEAALCLIHFNTFQCCFSNTCISFRTCKTCCLMCYSQAVNFTYKSGPYSDRIETYSMRHTSLCATVISMWTSRCELLSARSVRIFKDPSFNYIKSTVFYHVYLCTWYWCGHGSLPYKVSSPCTHAYLYTYVHLFYYISEVIW